MPEKLRAYSEVDPETGCWNWRRSTCSNGRYGLTFMSSLQRKMMAHRASYVTFVGPIPDGYEIDHLCKNTLCLNPAHLEPVTRRENSLRSDSPASGNAKKTHCAHGHPFEGNTQMRSDGSRRCLACRPLKGRTR